MILDPDKLSTYLGILGALGSGVAAFGAAWWRFSRWVYDLDSHQDKTNEQLLRLADSNLRLTEAITIMTVKLEEREKDTLKLEGAIELQRKDVKDVISSLQTNTSNLDALWRTLKIVYPDKVLKRMSDM